MRLNAEKRRLFRKVGRRLEKGMTLAEIAIDLRMLYNTLWLTIDRAGYEVETAGKLKPKATEEAAA